jgi:exonuclease SbcD
MWKRNIRRITETKKGFYLIEVTFTLSRGEQKSLNAGGNQTARFPVQTKTKKKGINMKVALTSDLHLTDPSRHPERYDALQNILCQTMEEGAQTLVIAGDLFDSTVQNFRAFEETCGGERSAELDIFVIPGNHDAQLRQTAVAMKNIHVIEEPEVRYLDPDGLPFLFLPYKDGTSMGERIEPFSAQLTAFQWVLVSHGDWLESRQEINPFEYGVFMPLTRQDIQRYQPLKVFLGHIHKPYISERICYMGSPCGLDISECGLRRFLLFDTESQTYDERYVNTRHIYFDEVCIVLPVEDEEKYIQEWAQNTIQAWGIRPEHIECVQVRVRARGYTADRQRLGAILKKCFSDFRFYQDKDPDVSEVRLAGDLERNYISNKVREVLKELEWSDSLDEPNQDEILLAALQTIYGA